MYTYNCKLVRIIDGDTLIMDIDLGFNMTLRETIRLLDVDAHELHGGDEHTKQMAMDEREYIINLLNQDTLKGLRVRTHKDDSFGRWLGDIYFSYDMLNWSNLSQCLKAYMNTQKIKRVQNL